MGSINAVGVGTAYAVGVIPSVSWERCAVEDKTINQVQNPDLFRTHGEAIPTFSKGKYSHVSRMLTPTAQCATNISGGNIYEINGTRCRGCYCWYCS